ncbi:hypothetical protein AAF712_006877 [Marasmius tenuissimus]|uniref:Uncharacterized protein n=1 Tax=Marasmius tenuissimus TaxID=585030 RepID=A0ABR2ZY09_9AGAR|nr:hypothetical protein PM082_010361 [Marasmius tenuissimus]
MVRTLLAVFFVGLVSPSVAQIHINPIAFRPLSPDPTTTNRLNGESYQQDALATFKGWQYASAWIVSEGNTSVRNAAISRRELTDESGEWETLILTDYNQTEDDGHDTISLGISPTDGTLHLGFDQHDNPLRYRVSKPGVALRPSEVKWEAEVFGEVLHALPGLEDLDASLPQPLHFVNITYPRFLRIPPTSLISEGNSTQKPDLLLELRVGRSGLGDDWIYHYFPGSNNSTGAWELVGKYLAGVKNNAYINGLDFDSSGNLHATWTYRDFINDTGKDVAVQAGPNGPENNHDLNYAYSSDAGFTWYNNWGQQIADLRQSVNESSTVLVKNARSIEFDDEAVDATIYPTSPGIVVFGIPKYGGILNQEAQTVDAEGRVHVLNRENGTGTALEGVERWYHYWRAPAFESNSSCSISGTPHWTRAPLPFSLADESINNITRTPLVIGKRGKLVAISVPQQNGSGSDTTLLALLPDNAVNSTGLSILGSTAKGNFRDWKILHEHAEGSKWEPLFDRYREDGMLSLYLVNGTDVGVLDIDLGL